MTNTPFSKQVEILANYYVVSNGGGVDRELAATDLWMDWSDTLMLCLFASVGDITLNDPARRYVDGAWESFCATYGVDKDGEYDSLDEFMDIAIYE